MNGGDWRGLAAPDGSGHGRFVHVARAEAGIESAQQPDESRAIGSLVRMVALAVILDHRTGGLGADLGKSFLRMTPAMVVAIELGLVLASPVTSLTGPVDGRNLWGYLAFGAALALITVVFMLVALAFRVPGAELIVGRALRRRGHPSPS